MKTIEREASMLSECVEKNKALGKNRLNNIRVEKPLIRNFNRMSFFIFSSITADEVPPAIKRTNGIKTLYWSEWAARYTPINTPIPPMK